MLRIFADYLRTKANFNDEELALIKRVSIEKRINKKQFLLKAGQIASYQIFIIRGCLRLFRLDQNGVEHTVRFAVENWWFSDYESYQAEQPSKYNMEALEDCELILISKKNMDSLHTIMPQLQQLKEAWEATCAVINQDRIHSIISETAEEKYEWFLKTNPQILHRVPLHMIASYLGISRETISRVRRKYAKVRR